MEISSSREGKSEIIAKNRIYWGAFDFLSRYVSLKIVFWCLALSLKTKKDNWKHKEEVKRMHTLCTNKKTNKSRRK